MHEQMAYVHSKQQITPAESRYQLEVPIAREEKFALEVEQIHFQVSLMQPADSDQLLENATIANIDPGGFDPCRMSLLVPYTVSLPKYPAKSIACVTLRDKKTYIETVQMGSLAFMLTLLVPWLYCEKCAAEYPQ